jgi:hypothetical protein
MTDFNKESQCNNACKPLLVNVFMLNTLFKEFYNELKERSRIVYYKGNQLGFNDNIYTSDDLLHDYYFSIKKYIESEKCIVNSKDHFVAISYLRMKSVYYNYLKKKWNRAKVEKNYFTELGYTHKPVDIIAMIFETEKNGILKEKVTEKDILDIIEDFDNDEQKRILKLKIKHVGNEKLSKYLGLEKDELRSKTYFSRKKLFKKMKEKNILNNDISYEDIIGRDSEKTSMFEILDNKKYYYNEYPFEASYKEKIMFILSKNDNKIDIEKLRLVLKINEGKSLKQDSKNAVNNSIEKNIKNKKCFIMDGVLYSNQNMQ